MNQQLTDVRNFMLACGQTTRSTPPTQLPRDEILLRCHLMQQMLDNLRQAMGVNEDQFGWSLDEIRKPLDHARLLDCLSDLIYTVFGTYQTLGLASVASSAFDQVHAANMTKIDPIYGTPLKDLNGRVLKGPHYVAPDFSRLLQTFNENDSPFK